MPIPSLNAQAVISLAAIIFIAGGAWIQQRQTRRDVNGIGAKLRRFQSLLLRWADTPEKREELARALEGK